MSDFVTGDEVYLDDGRIAVFVCKDRDGLIVRPILDEGDDENEPSYGRPLVVRQVYHEPPQERYSAEVARLREQQAALQQELAALRGEISSATAARQQLLKELQAHPDLTRLGDWIAGRITHVVLSSYDKLKIATFDEAFSIKNEYGRREPGLKLLTLFGKPHGGVGAYINTYSDGSGSHEAIIPCCSYQEGLAAAQRIIDDLVASWRAEPKRASYLRAKVDAALALGLAVPDEVKAYLHEQRVTAARIHLETKRAELDKAQAELATLVDDGLAIKTEAAA